MELAIIASTVVLALFIILISAKILKSPRKHSITVLGAPKVPGWPLIGNTLGVALHGSDFIHHCRLKYGDAFTLNLAGRCMTFLFSLPTIQHFFSAPDEAMAFRPAIQPFTQRVFGLPSARFFPKHSAMLHVLRGLLAPSSLSRLLQGMAASMQERLHASWGDSGEVGLLEGGKRLLFEPTFAALFGARCCGRHRVDQLQRAFFRVEAGFELAASPLPHLLQRGFLSCREKLLSAFRTSVAAGDFEGEIIGSLISQSGIEPDLAPKVMLAVLWAALSNSVPSAFWSTAFLLLPAHRRHLAPVLDSLPKSGPETAALPVPQRLIQVALERRSPLSLAVAEAVRLRSPGVDLRMAAGNAVLPTADGRGLAVRKGQLLAVSPYESHLDERLYGPRAHAYNPQRAELGAITGVAGIGGIAGFAFGGGRYRCPGRFFAEAQIALAVAVMLSSYDMTLKTSLLDNHSRHAALSTAVNGHASCTACISEPRRCEESSRARMSSEEGNGRLGDGEGGCSHAREGCGERERGWGRGKPCGASVSSPEVPGDFEGLLPPPELRRQVGVRWPQSECVVVVRRRC